MYDTRNIVLILFIYQTKEAFSRLTKIHHAPLIWLHPLLLFSPHPWRRSSRSPPQWEGIQIWLWISSKWYIIEDGLCSILQWHRPRSHWGYFWASSYAHLQFVLRAFEGSYDGLLYSSRSCASRWRRHCCCEGPAQNHSAKVQISVRFATSICFHPRYKRRRYDL